MTRPPTPAITTAWYDELQVAQPGDEQRGWPLLILLGALGHAFGPLHDLVRDTDAGPGWSAVLDPARCPAWALSWLAQFAGVRLTDGLTEAQQRAQITDPPAFERGTATAMLANAAPTLTGTQQIRFYERNPTPYDILAVTRTDETPDAAATLRRLRAQKPAGLILTHLLSDEPLIDEGTLTINAVSATIDAATLADVT